MQLEADPISDTLYECLALCGDDIAFAFGTPEGKGFVDCRCNYKTILMLLICHHVARYDVVPDTLEGLLYAASYKEAHVPNFTIADKDCASYDVRWQRLVQICSSEMPNVEHFVAILYKDGKVHTWCNAKCPRLRCLKVLCDVWFTRGSNFPLTAVEEAFRAHDDAGYGNDDPAWLLFTEANQRALLQQYKH